MSNEQLIACLRQIRENYALTYKQNEALSWAVGKILKEMDNGRT